MEGVDFEFLLLFRVSNRYRRRAIGKRSFVRASDDHVLAAREVLERAGVEVHPSLLEVLHPRELVEGDRLIPTPHRQQVARVVS